MSRKSSFRPMANALASAALCLAAGLAFAQEFPNKPLRIISPASAGTVTDTSARLYANQLNSRLGWTVLVENRAGGDFFLFVYRVKACLTSLTSLTTWISDKHFEAKIDR